MTFGLISSIYSFKFVLFTLIVILFLLGLHHYIIVQPRNECLMTYMYQVPQFLVKLFFHSINFLKQNLKQFVSTFFKT